MTAVSAAPPAPAAVPPAAPQVGDRRRPCVLVVDDEPLVLALTARMLRDADYLAVEAPNARQALQLLERGEPPIDLVLTDVVMPETDGRTLGRLIAERYRGLPVAYMSAYSVNDVFHRGAPGPNVPFLSKPFLPDALVAVVHELLGRQGQSGCPRTATEACRRSSDGAHA
jgi:two-component system, cell cycle sensor histidine kinase and response regulator CckA